MKKKLITIVIGAMLCAGLFAGCGQSDTKQDKAAGTESAKQANTKDEGDKGSQEEKMCIRDSCRAVKACYRGCIPFMGQPTCKCL